MEEKLKKQPTTTGNIEGIENTSCCAPSCCSADEPAVSHAPKTEILAAAPSLTQAEALKETVRQKYGEIAVKGGNCCGPTDTSMMMNEDYTQLEGYTPEADLGLGCGIPTEVADIQPGDRVLDLGSGAGNDVFVARSLVGESGQVIGVDMTPDMIAKANANNAQLGFPNVEFRLGEIEDLPVRENRIDVVVSNCVMNLVPDKLKAYQEVHRVLKPGGHFSISDIVIEGELPAEFRQAAELYVGCVAGAIDKTAYMDIIQQAGFEYPEIVKSRSIVLPDELLKQYLNEELYQQFKQAQIGILSVTVKGTK